MTDAAAGSILSGYQPGGFHCEMLGGTGEPGPQAAEIWRRLGRLGLEELRGRA